MEYLAIVSFSGLKLSMRAGDIRDISDESLASDLVAAHLIIPFEEYDGKALTEPNAEPNAEPKKEPKKAEKKTASKGKGKAKNEN